MNDEKITIDLVIDVQKDFITGALANTQAQANVAHLAETARAHAQAGPGCSLPVIPTRTTT